VTFHDPEFHRREITLLASRNATAADLQRVIGLLERGRIDLAPWITHRAALDDVVSHFPAWLRPESRVIKAMITT
jgi:threonine dehydrogenase-like Zn-dependent dehydrogenase